MLSKAFIGKCQLVNCLIADRLQRRNIWHVECTPPKNKIRRFRCPLRHSACGPHCLLRRKPEQPGRLPCISGKNCLHRQRVPAYEVRASERLSFRREGLAFDNHGEYTPATFRSSRSSDADCTRYVEARCTLISPPRKPHKLTLIFYQTHAQPQIKPVSIHVDGKIWRVRFIARKNTARLPAPPPHIYLRQP